MTAPTTTVVAPREPERGASRPTGVDALRALVPGRRGLRPAALVAVTVLASGCAGGPSAAPASSSDSVTSTATATATDDPAGQEYRYTGYAIGPTDSDQALLCGGIVLQSLPPQCGDGVTVAGWDWSRLDADVASGVSFGEVEVVGTWDAGTSTLTVTGPIEPYVRPSPGPEDDVDFSTPCPEPDGGWESQAPTDPALADFDAAYAAVLEVEGYALAWMDRNPGSAKPRWVVLNVSTAGDVAAMEAAARRHWSGPLCVTGGAERSAAELEAIRDEVHADHPDLLSVNAFELEGRVRAQAWVVPDGLQQELDERYGDGVVTVDAFLAPVD